MDDGIIVIGAEGAEHECYACGGTGIVELHTGYKETTCEVCGGDGVISSLPADTVLALVDTDAYLDYDEWTNAPDEEYCGNCGADDPNDSGFCSDCEREMLL